MLNVETVFGVTLIGGQFKNKLLWMRDGEFVIQKVHQEVYYIVSMLQQIRISFQIKLTKSAKRSQTKA